MIRAFSGWNQSQKDKVKVFIDQKSGLTDAEVLTELYKQRAIGFWHIQRTVMTADDPPEQITITEIPEVIEQDIADVRAMT
jgi:hypothetical protein